MWWWNKQEEKKRKRGKEKRIGLVTKIKWWVIFKDRLTIKYYISNDNRKKWKTEKFQNLKQDKKL